MAARFRTLFPTVSTALSFQARYAFEVWALTKRFSTKASEMGHAAERRALSAAAAPGKAWVPHCRREILRRFRENHIAAGGSDPSKAKPVRGPSKEMLKPCSPVFSQRLVGEAAARACSDLEASVMNVGSPLSDLLAQLSAPAQPSLLDGVPGGGGGQGPDQGIASNSGEVHRAERPTKKASGVGGNPKLCFLNHRIHSYKQAVASSRALSNDEVAKLRADAAIEWDRMDEAARAPFVQQFRNRARRRKLGVNPDQSSENAGRELEEYRPQFGVGCPAFPIAPAHFCSAPLAE
jgi:hypothetical protein